MADWQKAQLDKLEEWNLIQSAWCTDEDLVVRLKDGRRISAPLWWFPRLLKATPAQRAGFAIGCAGLHWEALDEDLSLKGLLLGCKAPGGEKPAASEEAVQS